MMMPQIEFQPAKSYDEALARAADECGIAREYWDIFHKRHEIRSDVLRRLLQALGWNADNLESLEEERARLFQHRAAFVFPNTVVIGLSDAHIPLSFAEPATGALCYEISLEEGQTVAGAVELSDLRIAEIKIMGEQRWKTWLLALPVEVPLGYHKFRISLNGTSLGECNLIVCPERAYIPERLQNGGRTAGFNVALYGLRSQRNWGCGDFTDLRALIEWARNEIGFSFIGLNPLHALHNRVPYNTSPYLPLSIFFKNLIYVDIESVPEFKISRCAQQFVHSPSLQAKIRKLREAEFVDYHAVAQLKRRLLKLLFRDFLRSRAGNPARAAAFEEYCEREGDLLHKFALYCALDEVLHKKDRNCWTWQQWPEQYRSPESHACQEFARSYARTVQFFKYTQFVIEEQLSSIQAFAKERGMEIGLYHDLAVATDNCGSDLWAHRNFFVSGCRVGAPPDDFSPNGQDWAFPPPNVQAHHDTGYRLYRESIRKIIRHGGALRIDHVMRLFRLFWIPDGASAAEGTYVRDNALDLLRILALESQRSKAIVIGEDLGTVTDEIREALSRFGVLSYRLLYFEKETHGQTFKRSSQYPREALVSSTTHDLPTIAGFWSGRDIEARKAAGLIDEAAYRIQREDRQREKQRMLNALHAEDLLPQHYTRNAEHIRDVDGDLHNAIVGFLAQVPSMILLLNQEDFTKETDQQNLPGSTVEYPNWQRKMRLLLEDLGSASWSPYAAMLRHQLARTNRIAP